MAQEHSDETRYRPAYMVPRELPPIRTSGKDPSVPFSAPTTSKDTAPNEFTPPKKKFIAYFYNKETGEILGRTCKSWFYIIIYSIMYLIFLATYTLVFLYAGLHILRQLIDYSSMDKMDLLTYPKNGIGLTAAPTSDESNNYPLIWYKNGEKDGYSKYVQALDKLLSKNRRKREVSNLGPCGQSPYGYGEQPCVVVRINRQLKWAGQPLQFNSTVAKLAPPEVQEWMKRDRTKLWLQCSGYHSYDKEHIGRIKYFPDPPGFDASAFPLQPDKKSPLVAIQISGFTVGVSLAVECKLWYDAGPSKIDFVLYVAPQERLTYPPEPSINV